MRRAGIASAVGALAAAAIVAAATSSNGADDDPGAGAAATAWRTLAPSPLERTEVAAARIRRHVYVVGGFDRATGATTNAIARYDIKRDSWRLVEPPPIAVNHATAASARGKLYVHGGYTDERGLGGATAQLHVYRPRSDSWKRLPDSATPRAAHALGAIGGKLYAAAGANSSTDRLRSLEVYDISKRRWKPGPEMEVGRNHVAGAVARDRLYVLGGRPGNLAVAEAYDPERRRWLSVPDLGTPRSGFAAVAVRRRVVAFGGETSAGTIPEVEMLRGRRWAELPDMLTPRHGLGGAARKGRVYALEGGPQPGFAFSSAVESLKLPRSSPG
jgi:N-acetylneuraminic acid mutarotase